MGVAYSTVGQKGEVTNLRAPRMGVLGYRDFGPWATYSESSSCGSTQRQQSPIELEASELLLSVDPLIYIDGEVTSVDPNLHLKFVEVGEGGGLGYYKVGLSLNKSGSMTIGGTKYMLVDTHVHVGGAEHTIHEEEGIREADATVHLVHHSEEDGEYAVLEIHLLWDEEGIDSGMKCPLYCEVCGAQGGACVHRAFLNSDNFCDLRVGEELSHHIPCPKGASVSGEFGKSQYDWLNFDNLNGWVSYGGGGLTTAPCNESVRFIVNPDPVRVRPIEGCDTLADAFGPRGNIRPPMPIQDTTDVKMLRSVS